MTEGDQDPYEGLRNFRSTERAQMIEAIRDLIEEARKRVKSNYTPNRERAKWMRLAGQLIWYKDQILRSMSYEALEKEVDQLKKMVTKKEPPTPPHFPTIPRRTIRGPGNTRRVARTRRSTVEASKPGRR